jgi:hypothetical protein
MATSPANMIHRWWANQTPAQHAQLTVVGIAVAIHLLHQWVYLDWYIEDAAISFAYARNLVDGEGLVAFRGGERIEGYSNPTWVALIALFEVFGIDGFTSGKLLAAFFGAGSIVWVWRLARMAMPEDSEGWAALMAPLILALNSHHVIWAASTLENSVLSFLMLGGCWQLMRDVRGESRLPWSSLWFLGVGLTRPEGTLYAAVAGLWFAIFCLIDRRGIRPIISWVLMYWVPMLLFVAARLWYFAYPLPNTYYAKFVTQGNFPLRWYQRGWMQVREYSDRLWQGWFLPVYVFGLLGLTGKRGRLAVGVSVVVGLMLLVPGPAPLKDLWFWPAMPEPVEWLRLRIGVIGLCMASLPVVAMGRPGGRLRAVLWSLAASTIWFGVLSNGDWMRGLRWMSLFSAPAAILLAVGLHEIQGWASTFEGGQRWGVAGWIVAAFGVGLQAPPNYAFSSWYQNHVDDFPKMIKRRVDHTMALTDKIFLEERVRPLDMDMGAHMWWHNQYPTDMAGLVNVPISMHDYSQRNFIEEYVFTEVRPHVAHVHAAWAKNSGFKTYEAWGRDYFPYVGYADGKRFHDGLFARRDLIMRPEWNHQVDRRVRFARGVELRGFDLPGAQAAPGRALFVDTAWSTAFKRTPDDPFSVTMFLSRDGEIGASWDLPMGYTMLGYPIYPVHWWQVDEVFEGKFGLMLPPEIEEGTWDIGFSVRGAKGHVLRANSGDGPEALPQGAVVDNQNATYSIGEVRFPGALTVVSAGALHDLAEADRLASLQSAKDGNCDQAAEQWRHARRHKPRDNGYRNLHVAEHNAALSHCWARMAEINPNQAPELLALAHVADHRQPDFLRIKAPVAQTLWTRAMAAREAGEHDVAYRTFSALLLFCPERSWARRYAEEARDKRLGIQPR